jgi:hypothetical protein
MQRSTGSHHARYGRRKPGNGLVVSLPGKPSAELLDRARREVPIYRDWMSHDGPSGGDPETRNEISRASARLIEISLHWRPAARARPRRRSPPIASNTIGSGVAGRARWIYRTTPKRARSCRISSPQLPTPLQAKSGNPKSCSGRRIHISAGI